MSVVCEGCEKDGELDLGNLTGLLELRGMWTGRAGGGVSCGYVFMHMEECGWAAKTVGNAGVMLGYLTFRFSSTCLVFPSRLVSGRNFAYH